MKIIDEHSATPLEAQRLYPSSLPLTEKVAYEYWYCARPGEAR